MRGNNDPLLKSILEGGKAPEIDISISISRQTIESLVVAAILTTVIILLIKKHLF